MSNSKTIPELGQSSRLQFVWYGVYQIILAAVLAPADGGLMLYYWITAIVLINIACYLIHFSISDAHQNGALSMLTNSPACFLHSFAFAILIAVALGNGWIPAI